MHLSWLAKQNAEEIALMLFIAMLAAAEVGYRFGCRWQPKIDQSGKGHFGMAQGVVLSSNHCGLEERNKRRTFRRRKNAGKL